MRTKKRLIAWAVAIILVLVSIFGSLFSQISESRAADTWTQYSGEVTLDNELYVVDAWVIKDGSTYKMWYTRGNLDLSISAIINSIKALYLTDIITDIANLDLDAFLNDLSDLNVDTIANIIDGTTAVIGYATSDDGKTWKVVDSEVLASTGGTQKGVGAPCVVKTDDSTYEMWYTNFTADLTRTKLQAIQSGLAGDQAARKAAIHDFLDSISTSIGYATSDNGTNWAVVNSQVLHGDGNVWNSVGAPSVIKDDAGYKMWYTRALTDIKDADLDAILAKVNAGTLSTHDLLDIVNGTTTVIDYATSDDGITWEVTPQVLPETSGGIWDSVADACVVKTDDSTYEMWYTNCKTNLTSASLSALLQEIKILPFATLWNSLVTLSLDDFFTDLSTLDISAIKNILSGTSSSIGYATSSDGTAWVVADSELLAGSGGAWASIGAPTVIETPSAYEMWYTEGIPDITLQNVFDLILGENLPIGYASYSLGATVEISVALQGNRVLDASYIMPITVKFFPPGADVMNDSPSYSVNATTAKAGSNAATANVTSIPPGDYDITIISEHTLTNVKKNVTITSPSTPVNMGTFREGDANADNEVTYLDVSTLIPSYGKSSGEPGYNALTDFDRSGDVTYLDVSVLIPNYLLESPIEVP